MPKGRIVRQDDQTKDKLKISATKNIDRPTLEGLTSDEGPLPPGALPAFKAASVAAQQKLHESLDETGKKVEKPKAKPKARAKDAENIEPKILSQWGSQGWVHETNNRRAPPTYDVGWQYL